MLLLVFGGLVFLFPVAAYCLFLAMINNRAQPTMVSGPWDFAGVLFATSGFLFLGGPTVLGAFHSRYRMALAQGHLPNPSSIFGSSGWELWAVLWGLYFVIVLGGAVLLLLRRRAVTVVYNIDAATLEHVLGLALSQLHLRGVRVGHRLFVSPAKDAAVREPGTEAIQAAPRYPEGGLAPALELSGDRPGAGTLVEKALEAPAGKKPALYIEPFHAMRNVSLRWRAGNDTLRDDVEAELARELARISTEDNPVAGWFLTVASCLFGALFLGLIGFIIFIVRTK